MLLDQGDDGQDEEAALDPLADLLFGLVAIIVPAVALMLPLISAAAGRVPARDPQAAVAFVSGELKVDGAPATSILASAAGVRIRDGGDEFVELARILDDERLAGALRRLRTAGKPVLLLIEPDGQEAAFLFEAVAAAHGPDRILQVRVDPACAFVRGPDMVARCVSRAMPEARGT